MLLDFVLASRYLQQEEDVRSFIKDYAAVINDVYRPLWEEPFDISLTYGGRGGGKSEAIVQKLVYHCIHDAYFKCYYGRKVFDNVRGSCFDTIIHNLEDMGVHNSFSFSTANTSPMVITHRRTGNKFIPFGSDKSEKLKSIKDPTDIWAEEFDQFTFGDFSDIYPTLRTERGANRFWATFNTHKVFPSHWILKCFFPDIYDGDTVDMDVLAEKKVLKIFANYTDNLFIDRGAYYNSLALAAGGNSTLLDGMANGQWGVVDNDVPWLYAFDPQRHVVPSLPFMPSFPIYVFLDINNDPLECTIWQMSPNYGSKNSFIHCIDEFSGKFKVDEMGGQVKARYPSSIIYVGGDRSGQNEDVGRNQTVYQILASKLGISPNQLLLNSSNLEHADSRILCNTMINNYPNFRVSSERCPNLIRQCQLAKVDNTSGTPSKLLKDRGLYKLDAFDSMRYMFQTMFNNFAKKTYLRVNIL